MKKEEQIEKYLREKGMSFNTDTFLSWLNNGEILVPECIKISKWVNSKKKEQLSIIFNDNKQELFFDIINLCYTVIPSHEKHPIQCKLVKTTWKELEVGDVACLGESDKAIEDIEYYVIKISEDFYANVKNNIYSSTPAGIECDSCYEDDELFYKLVPVK
jgi:hypothetical protein